ncbi:uncharacterized protein LOC114370400 [Glycine soja]|uniref:uncharacterized protein n=1 Tax=Glycine max TaxID=3847 RepID=UPI00023C9583|nr:uncharacterized protein LOC102663604 [Glycine max]XP_028183546.1 uncharacterized protein LOC114370400 [Glycine soja]|eukprot:XP_006589835.1 uncharacterized protein LOC102663604 [Glycine max]
MVRTPSCDKSGMRKGTWTPKEDMKLIAYVTSDVVGSNSIGCLIMVSWPFGIARMPRRLSVLAVTKRAKTCGLDWFGFGSRITITTTDIHLLHVHGVERAYEVEELNHEEALELFNWRAFRGNKLILVI